jgi:ribosomal protein L44E
MANSITKTQNLQSSETSRNTVAAPDEMAAMILSSVIDRARVAMGWNRLPQSDNPDEENSEQDVAIITWFEILADAGVPPERFVDCYRAAQARENERRAQGKERQIVTPNDLVVEWRKIKEMHGELNGVRMLEANAAGTCLRCYGTGKEEMLDGTVRDGCRHLPMDEEEKRRRQEAALERGAQMMREAMKRVGNPQPQPAQKPKFVNIRMECNSCHRRVDSDGVMWKDGDTCGGFLAEGRPPCAGQLFEFKRVGSPFPNS